MAGRDAGISVHPFGITRPSAGFPTRRCGFASRLKAVREAKNMIDASFLGWDEVRHAIAHRADDFIDPAREIEIREDLLREVQAETSISNSPAPVSRITEPLTDLHSRL